MSQLKPISQPTDAKRAKAEEVIRDLLARGWRVPAAFEKRSDQYLFNWLEGFGYEWDGRVWQPWLSWVEVA